MSETFNSEYIAAQQIDVKLIRAVKQRFCIYDPNDSLYINYQARARIWQEVAEIVGKDAESCKEKWYEIKNAFIRSIEENRCSDLYDELAFVLPFYYKKRSNEAKNICTVESSSGRRDPSETDVKSANADISVPKADEKMQAESPAQEDVVLSEVSCVLPPGQACIISLIKPAGASTSAGLTQESAEHTLWHFTDAE